MQGVRLYPASFCMEESDEVKPGVILDYDADGNVVGIEILDASRRMENPTAVELSVKAA